MSDNCNMPRHPMPKKNAAILKLQGTYRPDRHADRDESAIAQMITDLPPPPTLQTEYAQDIWRKQLPPLITTQRVAVEDVPVLEQAFIWLDEGVRIREEIKDISIMSDGYIALSSLADKKIQKYIDVMKKFGVTSQERLTLLQIFSGAKLSRTLSERLEDEAKKQK